MDFDIILLIDVLHFIDDKITLIKDLLKKLSINGSLIMKYKFINDEQIKDILKKSNAPYYNKIRKRYFVVKNKEEK